MVERPTTIPRGQFIEVNAIGKSLFTHRGNNGQGGKDIWQNMCTNIPILYQNYCTLHWPSVDEEYKGGPGGEGRGRGRKHIFAGLCCG